MTLSEFVESKTYKTIMKYVYGWGASVVLLGALFKIQHYPGAGPMLVAGMGTEVLIFFLSAFEPLHEDPDWTLVYPELAGMTSDLDDDLPQQNYMPRRDSRLFNVSEVPPPPPHPHPQQISGEGSGPAREQQGGDEGSVAPSGGGSGRMGGQSSFALQRFDQLLEQAELGPDLFVKMGEGIEKLANTAEDLNKMQDAVTATEKFTTNMQNASESAHQLSETYNSSNEVVQSSTTSLSESSLKAAGKIEETGDEMYNAMKQSADNVVQAFGEASNKTAEKIQQSGDEIAESARKSSESLISAASNASQQIVDSVKQSSDNLNQSYQQMIDEMEKSVDAVKSGNQSYQDQMGIQNEHLTALNSLYELQRQHLTQQNEQSEHLYKSANEAIENMSGAVEDTQKYKEELNKLNDNLAALNNVYGNMLSTFNLNTNE